MPSNVSVNVTISRTGDGKDDDYNDEQGGDKKDGQKDDSGEPEYAKIQETDEKAPSGSNPQNN